jgi:DNA polymerase-4
VRVPRFAAQSLSVAHPDLRGRPFVVVEQNPESHKTPVIELSPASVREAGARHVFQGLPAFMAKRKWPGLPVLERQPEAEESLRASLRALWTRWTPEFATRGNGGATLDMTGTPAVRREAPAAWAARLRSDLGALGLDEAVVAVASTRLAARLLAREAGPGDVRVCPPGEEARLLDPLSPGLLPGLSPRARERLRKYGLDTLAAVRGLEREELRLRFGLEGDRLHALARGLDFDASPAPGGRRALEAETVPARDLNDEEALRNQVRLTADKLGLALRASNARASRVTLALTYADQRSVQRTFVLHPPTSAFAPIAERAVESFFELYQRRVALRRIRLSVAAPAAETGQRELFEDPGDPRREALEAAIDRIRTKRAFGAVLSGSNVEPSPETRPRRRAARGRENPPVSRPGV